MTDEPMQTGEEASALSPASAKKPYERPVLTKLGALRDVTLTIWTSKGNRDGRKNRNTGRGGMNGLSRDANS
ncbi:MAG: hypothetical protein FD144_3180 [Rhodospirillaceae bacterium]|nr:MAG: hypothetical protein FD144_3180 [Rhodospirillaceae bacterium]